MKASILSGIETHWLTICIAGLAFFSFYIYTGIQYDNVVLYTADVQDYHLAWQPPQLQNITNLAAYRSGAAVLGWGWQPLLGLQIFLPQFERVVGETGTIAVEFKDSNSRTCFDSTALCNQPAVSANPAFVLNNGDALTGPVALSVTDNISLVEVTNGHWNDSIAITDVIGPLVLTVGIRDSAAALSISSSQSIDLYCLLIESTDVCVVGLLELFYPGRLTLHGSGPLKVHAVATNAVLGILEHIKGPSIDMVSLGCSSQAYLDTESANTTRAEDNDPLSISIVYADPDCTYDFGNNSRPRETQAGVITCINSVTQSVVANNIDLETCLQAIKQDKPKHIYPY